MQIESATTELRDSLQQEADANVQLLLDIYTKARCQSAMQSFCKLDVLSSHHTVCTFTLLCAEVASHAVDVLTVPVRQKVRSSSWKCRC